MQSNLLDAEFHKAIEAEIARAEGRYLDAVQLWDAVPTVDPLANGSLSCTSRPIRTTTN